jgi:Spy/CpxP family protein refolding chaperone
MNNWIKKTFISVIGFTLVSGALAGCSRGHHHDWNAEDAAHMRDKVADKLDLTTAQQEKLSVLTDQLIALKTAVKGETGNPRSAFSTLISGNQFDRSKAQAMLDEKTRAMQTEGPATITALADFYDSLNAQQQAKVRDKLEHRHRWYH